MQPESVGCKQHDRCELGRIDGYEQPIVEDEPAAVLRGVCAVAAQQQSRKGGDDGAARQVGLLSGEEGGVDQQVRLRGAGLVGRSAGCIAKRLTPRDRRARGGRGGPNPGWAEAATLGGSLPLGEVDIFLKDLGIGTE